MTQKFTRSQTTWVAYCLLALYAYFLNSLGPITPFLHDEFNLSYAASSLHFSAFAAGILVIGLAGERVIRRTGRRRALAIGALGLSLGALLLVTGRSAVITVGAAFLMGTVGSLILAVVPAALSDEHGDLRAVAISEANVLSSLLSTGAPLLIGWFAGTLIGWRGAVISAALLTLLVGVLLLRPDPAHSAARTEATGSQPSAGQMSGRQVSARVLPRRFWFYWLLLMLAVSIEFCMVGWSADYLGSHFGLLQASAAQAVSLFLAGMIVGRWVSSRVLRTFTERTVMLASLVLGLGGFLLFWNSTAPLLGLLGLTITGLGVAGLYPLVLALAIGSAGEAEAQAGARASLASGTAILCLPLVLGRLADLLGLQPAFGLVALLFALMLIMLGSANMIQRRVLPAKSPASVGELKR